MKQKMKKIDQYSPRLFLCGILLFLSVAAFSQVAKVTNSKYLIDSLYGFKQTKSAMIIHQISFRSKESFADDIVSIRYIDPKEEHGHNPMFDSDFLFVAINSKLPLLSSRPGLKIITVTVSRDSKIIDTKRYFWYPQSDGDYYLWLPLDSKYFNCIAPKTIFKIDIRDDATKVTMTSEKIRFDTYCETD